jgi:hypothetical protein
MNRRDVLLSVAAASCMPAELIPAAQEQLSEASLETACERVVADLAKHSEPMLAWPPGTWYRISWVGDRVVRTVVPLEEIYELRLNEHR